jgi:hypothetical protein
MVDSPHVWNILEDIIIDLFVGDPNTGLGLTAQTAFISLTIEKRSLGQFWNGTGFSAVTPFSLTMTQVDATNSPGLYRFTLPGATGNVEADEYFVHASVSNAPTVEGDNYSIHISRNTDPRIYESEPIVIQ